MRGYPLHIVFAGGGTGGHLFPGLAVARRLLERDRAVRVTFVGSGKEFEYQAVAAAGFQYIALPCHPLPSGPREAISFLVENLAGYLAAGRFLDERGVAGVVGLGGYASGPTARAAARRRIPLILLEQNAVPGRATRWLARRATAVCVGLPHARARLRCRCPVHVTGTPLAKRGLPKRGQNRFLPRTARHTRLPHRVKDSPDPFLLVLGGSGGAGAINRHVPRALYKVRGRLAGWKIIHQSGGRDLEATAELYRKLGLEVTVAGFIANLPEVMTAGGLAVSRAGGTTLAELAAAGLPAVLLPYPDATDDHQRLNAEVFARAGGAVMVDERDLPGRLDDQVAEVLWDLLGDPQRRTRMSAAVRRLARVDATDEVAAVILDLLHDRSAAVLSAAA